MMIFWRFFVINLIINSSSILYCNLGKKELRISINSISLKYEVFSLLWFFVAKRYFTYSKRVYWRYFYIFFQLKINLQNTIFYIVRKNKLSYYLSILKFDFFKLLFCILLIFESSFAAYFLFSIKESINFISSSSK